MTGSPTLNVLLCIGRCPTPNALLCISVSYFVQILYGAGLHIKILLWSVHGQEGFPCWLHQPDQGFYTKPGSVQYLYQVGNTYTEQGIWSRTPSYLRQGIRRKACGYTENAIQRRAIVWKHSASIQSRAPQIAVSHFGQW